jgi:alkane 1-monooxygenase
MFQVFSGLIPLGLATLLVTGYVTGANWPIQTVFWCYFAVTILDGLTGERPAKPAKTNPGKRRGGSIGRYVLWLWLPAQVAVLVCGLQAVTVPGRDPIDLFRIIFVAGMVGGMSGMPVAHELMHGTRRIERAIAELIMLSMTYSHFCIEHVLGHHARVGTPADPATARLGESLYAFLPRTIGGGFLSAWRIELARIYRHADRLGESNMGGGTPAARVAGPGVEVTAKWPQGLHRRNLGGSRPALTDGFRHRVLRGMVLQGVVYALIGWGFGTMGVAFFFGQSVVAVTILETINYVQHYGLRRAAVGPDRHDPVSPMHSWNTDCPLSNAFVLNLGLHSDHHCHAGKPFPALTLPLISPRLPTGLFGLCLLAFIPPLWRRLMDPLVQALRQ